MILNKMKNTILGILIAAFCFTFSTIQAQKFGYISSTQLLIDHPDIKTADAELVTYQNQLIAKGQQMVKDLESAYQTYMAEADTGNLSQVEMQQKEGELAVKQQEIQKYEYEVQNQIAEKRQELYQPILDKIQVIIEEVGKEQNYTMIFDSSTGGILSADEDQDLIAEIKSRLGI